MSIPGAMSGIVRRRPAWNRHRMLAVLRKVLLIVGVVVIWQALIDYLHVPPLVFPSATATYEAFIGIVRLGFNGVPFSSAVEMTCFRVIGGFVVGAAVGIPVGFVMGRSVILRKALTPLIVLIRPVPVFAYIAVLIVWFGIGETSKLLIVFIGASTIFALGTLDGVQRVPAHYEEAARTLGASRPQVLLRTLFPAALPQILDAARVAMAQSWTAVVGAEYVGTRGGIGVITLQAADYLRTDETLVGILLLAILGGLTDRILARVQRSVVAWKTR